MLTGLQGKAHEADETGAFTTKFKRQVVDKSLGVTSQGQVASVVRARAEAIEWLVKEHEVDEYKLVDERTI